MPATDWFFVVSMFVDLVIALSVYYILFLKNVYASIAVFAGVSSLFLGLHHMLEIANDSYAVETISEFLEFLSVLVLLVTIIKAGTTKYE